MRKFIFNRWTVIALVLLGTLLLLTGDFDGAKVYFILTGLFWLIAGCPKLFRWKRQREPLAKIKTSTPLGRRETGLDGCFGRIDPQLRGWLANNSTEGTPHDS